MANLTVQIIGDDDNFRAALARSQREATKFAANVNKTLSSKGSGVSVAAAFQPLLQKTQEARRSAEDLSRQLDETGKRSTVLGGGLGALALRVGAYGIAANAAYQASRHLSDALESTGAEAFTTSGRLKNLGAALLSGDLVAAFNALERQPKTLEDLGISAQQAAGRLDALRKVATGRAAVLRETAQLGENVSKRTKEQSAALDEYNRIVKEAGTANQSLAGQLLEQGRSWQELDGQMRGVLDTALALRDAQGQIVRQGGFAALRPKPAPKPPKGQSILGPGAVPIQTPKPLGPTAKNAAAQTIAQASGDLPALLALQIKDRDRLQKAFDLSTGNVQQRTALNAQLAAARAAVISTSKQIAETQKAQAKAASEARKQAKQDLFGAILSGLTLKVDKAGLTKRLNDDLAALEGLKAGLERQIRAGVDVQSAQAQLVSVVGQIAGKQADAKQKAADALQANQFRTIGLSAEGGEIIPGIANLKQQLAQIKTSLPDEMGTTLKKMSNRLAGVGKILSDPIRKATPETRKAIRDLFDGIRQELNKQDGPLTKTTSLNTNKVLKGLGLDPQATKEIRARLSHFNTAGVALAGSGVIQRPGSFPVTSSLTVTNENTIVLDGERVARSVTKSQQKRQRSNPAQKRGPIGGL